MQTTLHKSLILLILLIIAQASVALVPVAMAQSQAQQQPEQPKQPEKQPKQALPPAQKPPKVVREGAMTTKNMGAIIKLLDKQAKSPRAGVWQFTVENQPVFIITDSNANRMRIMVPVRKTDGLTVSELKRITQANFDTALDSRYAIARDILWSVYIHPLSELYPRQFIKGIGQTVNLAVTYGKTYSSGLLTYRGGDSRAILRRQLIDKLLKKGIPI